MNRNLFLGAVLTSVFLLAALISFVWTPYDYAGLDIANKLRSPSLAHPMGTDHFGRDILSMIMVGARTSIAVALVAVGIGMGLGVPLGLLAAAHRGDGRVGRARDPRRGPRRRRRRHAHEHGGGGARRLAEAAEENRGARGEVVN